MFFKFILSLIFSISLSYSDTMPLSKLKALCFQGNTESCNIVAKWYLSQNKKSKNTLKESKTYFQLSCHFGDVEGCYEVGEFYLNGKAGIKIKNAAMSYFEVACLGGHSLSCFKLASLYLINIKDMKKAIYYFKKSCYFGYEEACYNYKDLTKK